MSTDPSSDTRSLREDFATPSEDRWFEDYTAGDVREYGSIALSEDEIVDIARRYDPWSSRCASCSTTATRSSSPSV